MNECVTPTTGCPLLERLLAERGLTPKGLYDNHDAAEIFGVSTRTIQDWIRQKKIHARSLPGHAHFLSEDLEALLRGGGEHRGGGQ